MSPDTAVSGGLDLHSREICALMFTMSTL
jgi:hypothetical protein